MFNGEYYAFTSAILNLTIKPLDDHGDVIDLIVATTRNNNVSRAARPQSRDFRVLGFFQRTFCAAFHRFNF